MSEPGTKPLPRRSDSLTRLAFFDRMAWPVPVAFAPAVGRFRFEQGDVLYRDERAYETFGATVPKGLRGIQVLLPPRSSRAIPVEADADRRQSSWQSEITVELVDFDQGRCETRVITQGKLMTALWRGDESWLDPLREEPPIPRSNRELHPCLDQTRSRFDGLQTGTRGCRFIFVVDLASDASRAKARSVEEALAAIGAAVAFELSPFEAGIEDGRAYSPTLVIRCLAVPG